MALNSADRRRTPCIRARHARTQITITCMHTADLLEGTEVKVDVAYIVTYHPGSSLSDYTKPAVGASDFWVFQTLGSATVGDARPKFRMVIDAKVLASTKTAIKARRRLLAAAGDLDKLRSGSFHTCIRAEATLPSAGLNRSLGSKSANVQSLQVFTVELYVCGRRRLEQLCHGRG